MDAKTSSVVRNPVTVMSWTWRAYGNAGSRICRLVRSSHTRDCIVLSVIACGCVFQEPPDWEPPEKTRPQLMDPIPSPTELVSVSHPSVDSYNGLTRLPISLYERSEDNGDGIRAITFLNYSSNPEPAGDFQDIQEVPPGTYDREKVISLEWKVEPGPPECVPLTLIVTHASNAGNTHFPFNNEDVATITWWINLNNPGGTTASCPVKVGATP